MEFPSLEPIRRKGGSPPPIPEKARQRPSVTEMQMQEKIPAYVVPGFAGLEVAAAMAKKPSRKEHERGEDALLHDTKSGLLGVADGLGGEGNGAEASRVAVAELPVFFQTRTKDVNTMTMDQTINLLTEMQLTRIPTTQRTGLFETLKTKVAELTAVDNQLSRKALALLLAFQDVHKKVKEVRGKTTLCAGMIHTSADGSLYAIIANVGDSGALKLDRKGHVKTITEEDSLIEAFRAAQALTPELEKKMRAEPDKKFAFLLTQALAEAIGQGEEWENIKGRNLSIQLSLNQLKVQMTSSLGGARDVHPSLAVRKIQPGETLFFSTDGILDNFAALQGDLNTKDVERVVAPFVESENQTREMAHAMVDEATKAGVKPDDIGLVGVTVMEQAAKESFTKQNAA